MTGLTLPVRHLDATTAVIDVVGELTADSGEAMTAAYEEACTTRTRGVVLNFTDLDYMNSGGLGVLVTLLVRANRNGQQVAAYGLDEHYRNILTVTRLDEAIRVVQDEDAAAFLTTSGAGRER